MASDFVAEARPPLVREVKTDGVLGVGVVGESSGDVDNVAASLLQHLADGALGQREEAGEIDSDHRCIVVSGVVGERLGYIHAGIVDEGVDAAEAPECPADDPFGGGNLGDVPINGKHCRVTTGLDCPGCGHDRPAPPPVLGHKARADALRTPRDDRDLGVLFAHDRSVVSRWWARGTGVRSERCGQHARIRPLGFDRRRSRVTLA